MLAFAGLDVDVSGRLDASLKVAQREGEGRYGSGRLRLVEGRVFGEPFEEVLADVEVEPDGARVTSLTLAGPVAEGLASLHWSPHDGRWAITLERARVRLESLEAIRSRQLPLEGQLELAGEVRLGPHTMDGELNLTGRDWRYEGRLLGSPHGTATFAEDRLKARLLEDSGWSCALDLQLDVDAPFSAEIALEDKVIDFVEDDPDGGWARITGRATIEGALGRPEALSLSGVVDQLALQWAGEWLETADPVRVSLQEGDLNVSPMRLIGPETDLELGLRYDIDGDRLQAGVSGHLDLGLLRPSWPDPSLSG